MAITNKVKLGALISILIILFGAITASIVNGKIIAPDIELSKSIYELRTPLLSQIMVGISAVSSTLFTGLLTAIVLLILWIKKQRKIALFFGATLATSVIINNIIKYSVHRFRPDIAPIEDASFFSFPSGHSMNSLVFYGALLYIAHKSIKNKRLLAAMDIAAIIFVALVGFSRVYLGAHYPTDVIAGFCAGGAVFGAAIMIKKHTN
jgi:undecaprenyl-diphosphatase